MPFSTAAPIAAVRFKVDLPNYGVFDEKRVFAAGPAAGAGEFPRRPPRPSDLRGHLDRRRGRVPGRDRRRDAARARTARPIGAARPTSGFNIAAARVTESGLPLVYLNQVGGQDELVFDGASFVLNADRSLACQLPAFEEAVALTTLGAGDGGWRCGEAPIDAVEEGDEADYAACVLGLRDYVDKNRFPGVVLGLSGGIDSALCAAMAVDALGADRVHCVMLPYRYTSQRVARRTPRTAPRRSACATTSCRSRRAVEGFEAALQPLFAGQAARHHRGEHPEPRARHDPHVDLQQVRRRWW